MGFAHELALQKTVFNLIVGPPSSGGSRGMVRIDISLTTSKVLDRFRPGSGGPSILDIILALSTARVMVGRLLIFVVQFAKSSAGIVFRIVLDVLFLACCQG